MADFFKSLQEGFKRVTDTRRLADGVSASSLNNAVRSENFDRIRVLIEERGYDPNAYNLAGETGFHTAIKTGSVALAKFMIEMGADPLLPCQGPYQNPLHLAVTANKPRMVSFLKALGVPLNEFSKNGQAPLHHAVDQDRPEVVKALIQAGADPLLRTRSGRTATMMAITRNKPDVLAALLSEPRAHSSFRSEFYRDFDKLEPPLGQAIQLGRTEMAIAMIEAGLGVNHPGRDGRTPLHYAIENRNFELVVYLLRHGADVTKARDSNGETPLHLLCAGQQKADDSPFFDQAFAMMMSYCGDPAVKDNNGNTPLYCLASGPEMNLARFKAFLEAGVDIADYAPKDVVPLPLRLVTTDQVECLQLLLDEGRIEIDTLYGPEQMSLVHHAAQQNRSDLLEILLNCYKPNLMIRNAAGERSVDIASKYNNRPMIDLLSGAISNDNTEDHGGEPLPQRARQSKPPKPY